MIAWRRTSKIPTDPVRWLVMVALVCSVVVVALVAGRWAVIVGPDPADSSTARLSTAHCKPVSVAAENRRAGGAAWRPNPSSPTPLIAGYADQESVACGSRFVLRIAAWGASSVPLRVEAWRLGYYGGQGGRLVWTSPTVRAVPPAHWSHTDLATHKVTAPWPVTMAVRVGTNWPQGVYVLVFRPLNRYMVAARAPLIVRDPSRQAPVVYVLSTLTWEMYNTWGGWSAYQGPNGHPALEISMGRPYSGDGLGSLLADDYPLVQFAESRGMNIAYAAAGDLHAGMPFVRNATALVFGSHPEYWTTGMRVTLDAALRRGANALFFGANNIYWRPVPAAGQTGSIRDVRIWKLNSADPHARSAPLSSGLWAAQWIGEPAQVTLGENLGCTRVNVPMTLPTPLGWVFAKSGGAPGQVLPGLWYQEADWPSRTAVEPAGAQVVTSTAFPCPFGGASSGGAAMALVPTSGGGLVMDAGTRGWLCHLNSSCQIRPNYVDSRTGVAHLINANDPKTSAIIRAATATLLNAVSGGPASALLATNPYPAVP